MLSKREKTYIESSTTLEQYYGSLLKLNRQDLIRKNFIMGVSVFYTLVFISFAIMQSGALKLTRNQLTFFSNLMDYIALFLCLSFLISGLFNVLYLEKEKKAISDKLKQIDQKKLAKIEKKSIRIKCADFLDNHANKVDLAGAFFTTGMQALAVFSLTLPSIFDVSRIPTGTAFNLQGIIDTVGNILFTIAAAMFLISYVMRCKKNKDGKSPYNMTRLLVISGIFFGTFLVFAGKVLLSFETRSGAIYTGSTGPFGMDILPVALIIRSVGMAMFCIAYAMMIYCSIKEVQELSGKVSINDRDSGVSNGSVNSDMDEVCGVINLEEKQLIK
ncbi:MULTISPECIES: hypothetical protein [Ehrlichia]|uniref:Putative membrane protein n=1 Tax=Ehrlichia cf. muris str. EmCRT TaxID=1359167 RepID=A0A0F3N9A5_9RICK|nr:MULTISPECIES: hypothetical protein [Ehrlichia]KJV63514.1 putative membrane protein [Ehrlichia cf. muris str. EmCRT]OUC04183.1 hypothetical protein DB91_03860 [Ehrlichia sp. Wisconsin_h]